MSYTIIRPPLVYGPGVKGSLAQLTRAVLGGVPLPLGSVTSNRRDMIGVRNLAQFIICCAEHSGAAAQVFTICDGAPLSTRGLIEAIARAAGRRAVVFPMPVSLLHAAGAMTGKSAFIARLTADYRIDDAKARQLLGWTPETEVGFDIARMAASCAAFKGGEGRDRFIPARRPSGN